jgi:hypothetical protein
MLRARQKTLEAIRALLNFHSNVSGKVLRSLLYNGVVSLAGRRAL